MSKKELDKNLRYFYAEARTRDGALYSRSSLLGLRNAIERYLNTRSSSEKLRACSDVLSGAMSGGPRQPNSLNAVTSSGNPLAAVNSTVVHSQNNTAQQFVKYQPQALSSLFSNCQVNNIQVFMGHDSAGFH